MAKKAAKAAPKHVEAEDESQDLEAQEAIEAQEPDEAGGKGMTKAEAIRRALAAGFEGPQEGTAYIRKEFGIEVAPQHFSATKSQMKNKPTGRKGKPGRKPRHLMPDPQQSQKDAPPIEHYFTPEPKPTPAGGSELLDAMEVMKPLIASLGKEQVHRIVDLLG
jgi:hypothetical protein